MNVVIQSVTHDDPTFFVFRATDGVGPEFRYVSTGGMMQRCPQPGECWALDYTEEIHEKYGLQRIVARGAAIIRPQGNFIRSILAKHPALRGIGLGEKTAKGLYDLLGANLVSVLTQAEYERLSPVLDYDTAVELCDRWNALQLEPEVLQWLDQHGIEGRIASKLVAIYGADAIPFITENPYVLLPFFSFATVDSIARIRFGVPDNDPRRKVAATEAILYDGMEAGHTALSRSQVLRSLHMKYGWTADSLDLAIQQQVIFADGDHVRAFAPTIMEQELEDWVRKKIAPSMDQGEMLLLSGERSLQALIAAESSRMGIGVTQEQSKAVLGALLGRITCIAGGAGVGKTTVLRLLAAVIADMNGAVCFMAVTGRAAKRIRESLGEALATRVTSISTVAKFVNTVAADLPPDSTPWLIIDEASMLDLQSAHRIIERAPSGAKLVFVGDPGQLPPIGAGLVYHRLMDSPKVPRSVLTTVFRQAAATGIPSVTQHVRNGEFHESDFPRYNSVGHGVQLHPATKENSINEAIRVRNEMAQHGEVQILTLFKGAYGAQDINRAMHALVPASVPRLGSFLAIAVGEPVIYLKNDLELDLQNGSVGIVHAVLHEPRGVLVRWDDGIDRPAIAGANLANLDLAHGITTHKAQGSAYERVVIVIPRSSQILDRSLIYTALTRARIQAVIVGDVAAVREAILAEPVAKRRTVLFLSSSKL